MSPDEYTIDCAIKRAVEAWESGRRDEWPEPKDYRELEDELETQPGEDDRRVFAAAWHVQTKALIANDVHLRLTVRP